LVGKDADELEELVVDVFERALAHQKDRFQERFPLIAHYIILTTIDEAWLAHLYTLDDLKEGIGLTAYAGTDPVVVFKRESFVLFQEMLARTAQKIVSSLLNPHLTVQGEEQPQPERKMLYVHAGSDSPSSTTTGPAQQGGKKPVHAKKTPGRNDPCPCGSGKKYKNCCGKNA
ncbi:MAG TPA: preprotein translocase subunit SecA, partial [Candidatus Acetothermia bacterium]|nr:preprotein translocase subunit SecA [Candidatus Acetothermia bacterium]